ncbi:MAG: S8 family serine peptidase [Acidobacteriota bacterium]|nr:S8 family serine peptidase [Acidobacteriota bacterium]
MILRSALLAVACGLLFLTSALAQGLAPGEDPGRSRTISLTSGVIDAANPAPVPESLSATEDAILLVKFPGPVDEKQLERLRTGTDRVYTYLPHDTFLVRRRPEGEAADLLRATGARWALPYHPAYKLSPATLGIGEKALQPGARDQHIVLLQVFPDADLDRLRKHLEELGIQNVVGSAERGRFPRLRLLLTSAEVERFREPLALAPEIFWIDIEPRRVLLNDTTVWVGQSGTGGAGTTPVFDQGIYGEGQIVAVLDTGIDPDMCYFRDPALGLPPRNECDGGTVVDLNQRKVIAVDFLWSSECSGGISSSEWDTQDHGTHVAGTVAGDNLANPLIHDAGDGMAPGAKLVVQDCGFQTDNCADCPGIGCPVVDLNPIFQQAYDQGARIHTNSWGDEENNPVKGRYTAGSQDADEFMWNHKDFLLVFAAGNDGPGTGSIGSPSTGKNVISVGATLRGTSAESMASFSSCGPTADGRIKPDVTMPGSGIISANSDNNTGSNNCNTKSSSGTSMAAPGVAGAAALVRQYFTDGWYPSGNAVPGDALTPSAALVKATVMNSATEMSGTAAIPGGCQGWGRVLLDDALFFGGESRELFVEDDTTGFASGSSGVERTFNVAVGSSLEPLKVTLVWTDFPAVPLADPVIVNDLDLEVSGPSGTYLGNVFSGGASTTGGSADRLNSVEQALLPNPQTGTYTVTVRAFNVPSGPQPFALVVTGALTPPCSPAPIANAGPDQQICQGDSVQIGTAAQSGHSYSWSPGGQSSAQITVSPAATTTYTVTAATSCGNAQDSATVTVDDGSGGGLSEDFEGGAGSWSASGLWHLTSNSSCASPGYSSPVSAFYFGQDSGCSYDTGGATNGDLVSPVVSGITSASTLSFDFFRQVESYTGGSFDRTEVAVSTDGTSWTTLWSRDSTDVSAGSWQGSGDLSLAAYAGQQLQVRFRFDTVDGTANGFTGWFIDDVVITGESACGPGNAAPVVSITAPANGSSFDEGTSVSFAGTANDAEDGNITASLSWSSDLDGAIGSGGSFSTSSLSVGNHTITASVTDSGGAPGSDSISVTINAVGGGDFIDFDVTTTVAYSNQDTSNGSFTTEDGGFTFSMTGNRWRRTSETFTLTANTVIEFDFLSTEEGEIHGIGFDENDTLTDDLRIFNVFGTQNWASDIDWSPQYTTAEYGTWKSYSIPVGQYYTGSGFYLVLANDKDSSPYTNTSKFRNVRIYEDTPPPGCIVTDFSGGTSGWTNSGSSTCSTGTFVAAVPTEVVNGGVTTQVGGDHTGGGNAYFTATNSSAGADDVDGGNCIAESSTTSVTEASDVSVWYFHGQRDTGGDASGDFFLLEISTNGGSTWSTLASNGDSTSNAAWTEVTTTVPAGSDVRFRIQASDGTASGDLVEAGVDDISICPSGSLAPVSTH